MGKFSFFIFNLFTFQIQENIKAKFFLVIVKNSSISQIEVLLMQKNLSVLFFPSEEETIFYISLSGKRSISDEELAEFMAENEAANNAR